ncbi:MAG: hypothetical protein WC584_01630 [Candidatus Pacearchaeota archaeon]
MLLKRGNFEINHRAQITIFVIIAIIIIGGVITYFLVRDKFSVSNIPTSIEPLYQDFLRCLEEDSSTGINILESQGGYIETPRFEPGSGYMPFSSQLDFLGMPVPYWYYISGNNIQKEQIPSINEMEQQLGDYIEKQIVKCDLTQRYNEGFEVNFESPTADVKISDDKVDVNLNLQMSVKKDDDSAIINSHKMEISSKLGNFYNYARKIYGDERKNKFLENYGVDVLRLYAPVDGVEFTCSPKVWNQNEVKTKLVEALEVNTQTIKIKGDYYSPSKENKYFIYDIGEDANDKNVNFLYSKGWPTKIEVYPDNNPMIASPIGNQPGLGILGFCYVPYHFVYDFAYPVLIQIYDEEELFQFPVAVVINKNLPVEGIAGEEVAQSEEQLCKYMNQEIDVYTYDVELQPVEAGIDFECLGTNCNIGETKLNGEGANLKGMFPKCVNGYVSAKAEGYVEKRIMQSTNEYDKIDIILDKLYEVPYALNVDGRESSDFAIINFISDENSQTAVWPDMKTIKLSEGSYNISVYVYKNSTITLPGIQDQKCSEVPKSGILGILGMTEEKCFDINLPAQKISNIISGGGNGQDYVIASQLENGKLKISVNSIPLPRSLDELQDGYNRLEVQGVYLSFE